MDEYEDLRRQMPDLPPPAEENQARRIGRIARDIQRQVNGSGPVIGHAIEHSIEDPLTGEITVRFVAT